MDDPSELQRLRQEAEGLRRRISRLASDNEHLENRVERLETSIIFRTLRRIGHYGSQLLSRFRRRDPESSGSRREYAAWAREAALVESLRAHRGPCPSRSVCVVIDASHQDMLMLEQTLASVRSQTCPVDQIFICAPKLPPVEGRESSCTSKTTVLTAPDLKESIAEALQSTQAEFVAIAGPGAILEPDAVRGWLEALAPDTNAVYSDWDSIGHDGKRHSPRFTPEFSPELLLHAMYWGRCFLVRAGELREIAWPARTASLPLEHDLALRIRGPVARVPRVLWHLLDGARHGDWNGEAARAALEQRTAPANVRASIVVCSRRANLLDECLSSLRRTIHPKHEVVVVAHQIDGSADLRAVAERHGAKTVIYEAAFHFGRMNQSGVAASSGDVVVLLNDDVQPIESGWLEAMIAQAVRPDAGIVGALLFYPGGAIQHAGIVFGSSNVPAHAGRFGREWLYWPWLKMTREVSAVTGACMAMRRPVWDDLGGFDPHFPVNYNDVDLCLRAAELGYRVILETGAKLIHKEAQTRTPVVRARERELFWEKWQRLRDAPDPYFNPQLDTPDEKIGLRQPWI